MKEKCNKNKDRKEQRGNTFVNTFENNCVNCMCLRQLL